MALGFHLTKFLLFAGLLLGLTQQTYAQTQTDAQTSREHLAAQVQIRRTHYGVPHIKADTLQAVGFGFGYCQAEDHLQNVMHSVVRARGELAETFGGQQNVESDFQNRQYQVRQRAIATYHRLDADFRSMLEGFAEGINHYVDLHRSELPEWIPTINGHDIAAHGLTGVARFAFDRDSIVEKFLASQQHGEACNAAQPNEDLLGSNMWAFAPQRTTSGNSILMGTGKTLNGY